MSQQTPIPLPKNTIDETGHQYGRLTVREYAGPDPNEGATCKCGDTHCRRTITARGAKLRSGSVVSCGRLRANPDIRQAARTKAGDWRPRWAW